MTRWSKAQSHTLSSDANSMFFSAIQRWAKVCFSGSVNMRRKIAFSYLLQAGKRNFFTSYSQNPERTIKCTPILVSCILRRQLLHSHFGRYRTTSTRWMQTAGAWWALENALKFPLLSSFCKSYRGTWL